MRSRKEIEESIIELTPILELTSEAYFSMIESKQKGEDIPNVDFIRITSEYDVAKIEIETLKWVLNIE